MRSYIALGFILLALSVAGCMRTDQQITADVQKKLNSDSSVPGNQVAVSASGGVVTLTGAVSSEAARNDAANDAAQVSGVKTVVNNLVVQPAAATTSSPAPATAQ